MIVEVLFYDPIINAYAGQRYTYYCSIPVVEGQNVLAPVQKGNTTVLKKAKIMSTNLPESVIRDSWKMKVKTITQFDSE